MANFVTLLCYSYLWYIFCWLHVFILHGVPDCRLVHIDCWTASLFPFFPWVTSSVIFDFTSNFYFFQVDFMVRLCHVIYKWRCFLFLYCIFIILHPDLNLDIGLVYLLSEPVCTGDLMYVLIFDLGCLSVYDHFWFWCRMQCRCFVLVL